MTSVPPFPDEEPRLSEPPDDPEVLRIKGRLTNNTRVRPANSTRANLSFPITNAPDCPTRHGYSSEFWCATAPQRPGPSYWYAPQRNEGRHPDPLVHVAGRARGDRTDPRPDRSPGRRRRLRLDLGDGPFLPDPGRRQDRGADARGLDHARVHGRAFATRAVGADGRWRPLPEPGPVGQGGDDARRAVRRPGLARDRGRLERGGVRALGFPFPPLGERFEMLEETLQIAHGMWEGERGSEEAFQGRLFQAERLLNSPQSLSRPRVPIMVGGGGERKTLRLVAQYADACNVFGSPEGIARKYAILAEHCAAVGRDPREIEHSTLQSVRLPGDGRRTGRDAEPGRRPLRRPVRRRRPARRHRHARRDRSGRARDLREGHHPESAARCRSMQP